MGPGFHLPEKAFPLHLLLQRTKGLLDIIVANDDLNDVTLSFSCWPYPGQTQHECLYRTSGGICKAANAPCPIPSRLLYTILNLNGP